MSTRNHGMSRRDFAKAAAVAALPIVLPRGLRADDPKAAPSERINLGFIGVGRMNREHLGHFLGQKDVQVVAVCDVDTTRRESAKQTVEKKYGEQQKNG